MKAILEVVKMNVADVITTSGTVCGDDATTPPTCSDD